MEAVNRQIAEKIMGWILSPIVHLQTRYWVGDPQTRDELDFEPYANLTHAFMVVEKMREKGWDFTIQVWKSHISVTASKQLSSVPGHDIYFTAKADTPSAAICIAALEATKGEQA